VQQTVRAGSPGAMSCISELDNWNFHWQRFYTYRTQPRVTPDTTIEVTCDYNTSADTAPVLPGWGTQNEMCLPVLMIALPPSGP
jgi:Tfp pilus assembly protein PilV